MSGQFILGADLHPQLTTKAIKLRCVRNYVVTETKGENNIRSQECVFVDEQGIFIHVHIPKDIVSKYKNEFKEGQVYGIRNFLCITNFFKYKTSTLRYMIKFKYDTLVKQYKRIKFPKTMFRFKSFPAILSKQDVDEKVLMDVIGRVVEIYSPLEKVIAGKKTKLIDFVLEDMSKNQIKCTLWDDHVDQLIPYFNQDVTDPVILLIQLCRAKFMDNGEVRICSSFDATQLFFSHPCKEFVAFKSRSFTSNSTPLRCIDSSSRLGGGLPNGSGTSKEVLVSSIEEIYSKKKWIVRYRVIVRVADETGDAPMLIWDRECADLVGIAAADLKEKYPGGNNSIPPELGRLHGMSMLFRIAMKKDQVESYYSAFTVLRVCKDEAVLTQHCSGFLACGQSEIVSADGGLDVGQACEQVFVSDDEECKGLEIGSEDFDQDQCVGLDEIPTDLDDEAVAVPLKRCLMKDFDAVGSSKKPKVAVVKKEK
ncbi:PREDICTED: uncharacterized protein LOC109191207 [Ipomoea nil]|uniref:uncharacterized protein LOC109191207 n=1 Tax=Ipomoea nil TaxID=35883 RepID=UPI000901BE62|nr:PREDICTED: uncharacterized protein LOC109191207 [Ipomoea nil]